MPKSTIKEIINKRKEIREEEPKRIPRLKGLTLSLIHIHKSQNPNTLKQIKENILEQWLIQGLQVQGEYMNVEQLSQYLNMSTTAILLRMNRTMEKLGNWIKDEKMQSTSRALFSMAIFKSLETASIASKQTALLMAEQGDKYVPFLTSEVNKSIANLIASNKPTQGLLEILKPNTTIMPYSSADGTSNKHTVTPDEAIKLIRENTKSIIEDPNSLEAIWAELNAQKGLPDVDASHQDLSEIGIGKGIKKGTKNHPLRVPKNGPNLLNPTAQMGTQEGLNPLPNPNKSDAQSLPIPIPSQHLKKAPKGNIINMADEGLTDEDFRI
jgi:hypothetical protein